MLGWLTIFFLTGLMITVSVDDPFLDKKSAVEIFMLSVYRFPKMSFRQLCTIPWVIRWQYRLLHV